jgi:hypothetical protein
MTGNKGGNMKNIVASVVFLLALFVPTGHVAAAETQVFDSTDHYLGACQLTDSSSWDLKEDLTVSKFQIWYYWNQDETSLPVTVKLNGEKFAEFEAKRGDCDPYQHSWCNADYAINKVFPKGSYSTEIPNKRQCLKPGGTGAIRLYTGGSAAVSTTASPTPTVTITETSAPIVAAAPVCSCNQVGTIAAAAGISSVLSIVISLILKKR